MKCQFCGKHINDIDCSCGWCSICGWEFDLKAYAATKKEEKA